MQSYIWAQNEKVIPTVAPMLEALEFSDSVCFSNVFGNPETHYHIGSCEDLLSRPISFWCAFDRLLIVLDKERETEELPLPIRVLIAHGEINNFRIKIIVSNGSSFKRKKKRLYWEDEDVQRSMEEAKERRKAFTQKISRLHLDPEYEESNFGIDGFDAIDIPFSLVRRLSEWFSLCHQTGYFCDKYSPEELAELEEKEEKELNCLIEELRKALPHVIID